MGAECFIYIYIHAQSVEYLVIFEVLHGTRFPRRTLMEPKKTNIVGERN